MRAPPEAEKMIGRQRCSKARSNTARDLLADDEPIDPPMNSKLKQPTDTGCPLMRPSPPMKASFSSRFLRVLLRRSRYFLESLNWSGSSLCNSVSSSWKTPSSRRACSRARAGQAMWKPQSGQTFQFRSSSWR